MFYKLIVATVADDEGLEAVLYTLLFDLLFWPWMVLEHGDVYCGLFPFWLSLP